MRTRFISETKYKKPQYEVSFKKLLRTNWNPASSSKGYFIHKIYSTMYLPWRYWVQSSQWWFGFWLELQEPVQPCEQTSVSRSV